MTPVDLRNLAAYHAARARCARQCAALMAECPAAEKIKSDADRHDDWASKLIELADAFYAFAAHQ